MEAIIDFIYVGQTITIQCNKNEYMKDIFYKFSDKVQRQVKDFFFLYNGQNINEKKKLGEIIGSKKRITVITQEFDDNNNDSKNFIKISNYIICPDCGENCLFNYNDFKINLNECDKGHININLSLDEFLDTQKIDESKIICYKCNKNKTQAYNNKFYKCGNCNVDICPLCKEIHNKEHIIIDYDNKNYICKNHGEKYISYCQDCSKNLCDLCGLEHNKSHKFIYHRQIILNNSEKNNNKLKLKINKFKDIMNNIIYLSQKILYDFEKYFELSEGIINNYDKKNKNYQILKNIENLNIFNEKIIKDIDMIIKETNFDKTIEYLKDLIKKMTLKNDEIIIEYKNNSSKIRLFGDNFVENNKDICSMVVDNKKYKLTSHFNVKQLTKKLTKNDSFEIKLKGLNNVENMSYMFNECDSLLSLGDISKIKVIKVTNMKSMFSRCISLSLLPDISKWDISNVTDISYMFYNCKLLSSLPDISKWNICNVTDLSCLFASCSKLSSIPDISKWNTSKVKSMNCMFQGCLLISSIPNISKWNISNVFDLRYMFSNCKSLLAIPDLSKWNFCNVNDISGIFYNCISLSSKPDILKWKLKSNIIKKEVFDISEDYKKSLEINPNSENKKEPSPELPERMNTEIYKNENSEKCCII